MRGLLRIVGPLPLVLGLGALRMSNSRVDRSLAGLKKGAGQLLDFAPMLASAACGRQLNSFQFSGKMPACGRDDPSCTGDPA